MPRTGQHAGSTASALCGAARMPPPAGTPPWLALPPPVAPTHFGGFAPGERTLLLEVAGSLFATYSTRHSPFCLALLRVLLSTKRAWGAAGQRRVQSHAVAAQH